MRRFITLILLLCVCGPAAKSSAAVVITFDDTQAWVVDGPSSDTDDQMNTGGTTAIATLPGYSSTTTSLFNPGLMAGSFVQTRGGDYISYSAGEVTVQFTTDTNASYTASGIYSNSGGLTKLGGSLIDVDTLTYVFQSEQSNIGGLTFLTLGGTAGNDYNILSGSLTGTLLAGHTYIWNGFAYTQAYPTDDGGAAASGDVSLTIGAVPEFSSAIVWSMLALSIGGARWWHKRTLPA